MSTNLNRPLIEFESTNYPDGKRKCTRITVGGASISFVSIIAGTMLSVSGKFSIFAWFLKIIGR